MDKTVLEQRIKERAEAKFRKQFEDAVKKLRDDPILSRLTISPHNKSLVLVNGGYGVCYATDMFYTLKESDLLRASTNFSDIKEALVAENIQSETDSILSNLEVLTEFLAKTGVTE
jgi:hypothetical protein